MAQKPMRVTRARVTSVSLMKSVASLSANDRLTLGPEACSAFNFYLLHP